MTDMNETKYCSDHEVSPLPNNIEKSDEEKDDESYYLLMSSRTSSSEEYSYSSLDIALKKIIKKKEKDVKSSKVKNELTSNICKKPLYLTKKLIESWVNTGYLPYQTASDNAKVDTDSLNQKHSFHKTSDKIINTLHGQRFVHMDKSNSTKLLCNNNSFNCSSVDTAAYILSNIKAKKKGETISTLVNTKSSSKILPKNTLHENMSLEKDETQNMHINLNLSMSNVCDSGTKHTENKTEKNNIHDENDSTLKPAINNEDSFNLKGFRQKKLYTGRDSPTDIVETKSKNNKIINKKKNLHPAFRSSPPLGESPRKSLQKKKRSKFVINNSNSKVPDNISNDNLEECITKKEPIFIDLEDNLTNFRHSIPAERLHISCNALIEQIKRFPTTDYINDINHEKRNLRERIPKKKKTASKTTFTIDDVGSKDFQKILHNNPYVILNRLPENIIKHYTKKKTLQSSKEELMKSNKINDKDTCNNNNKLKDSIDSDVSTILLYKSKDVSISKNNVASDCSTFILNSSHSLNSDNVNYKSDEDTEQNQLNRDLEKNQPAKDLEQDQSDKDTESIQLDKDLEQNELDKDIEPNQPAKNLERNQSDKDIEQPNQLDKNLEQNLSNRDTEHNQLDKDIEPNQLDKNLEQIRSDGDIEKNKSDKDIEQNQLDKELDKNLNKDLDNEKLKCLQPLIVTKEIEIQKTLKNSNNIDKSEVPRFTKRMKIQRRENNSNDTDKSEASPLTKRMKIQRRMTNSNDVETSETFVKRTSERKIPMARKSSDSIYQLYGIKHITSSLINISSNTAFFKTLQPVVMLPKTTNLTNLKTNCASSIEESFDTSISSDQKLSMNPIVKLKRLSTKYNVKRLYKNNNKRYKDSSENDKVQVKEKKYRDKLRKNLSLNNSNSKITEPQTNFVGQRVQQKRRPVKNIKKLPTFYTRDNHSYLDYNSDSNSKSASDSDLDANQPFMRCTFNFYENKTQHERNEGKNTKIHNSNIDMAKSINQIILYKHTNMNTYMQTRSHSIKNRSILYNVSKMLNNSKMNDIEVNMKCRNSNEQCNTELKRILRKSVSINEKDEKKLIVNKRNNFRKSVFITKAYETNSDSSTSE